MTVTPQREDVREALEDALTALHELSDRLRDDTETYDALRHGSRNAPYAVRNLLSDLEGSEGGWLVRSDDTFIGSLLALQTMLDEDEAGESPLYSNDDLKQMRNAGIDTSDLEWEKS